VKIIALTGNQRRHRYFVNYLSKHHNLVAVFAENRFDKNSYGSRHSILQEHFDQREETEQRHFPGHEWPESSKVFDVPRNGISSVDIEGEIKKINPEGIAVMGCGMIKRNIIELSENIINAHQGLSPYYRGSGTNFWPFFNEEPEYVGMTAHYIDPGVDTGEIISHGRPEICSGDTLHDIGCNTIKVSADIVSRIFSILEERPIRGIVQWNEGKDYTRKDFTIAAVDKVQQLFANGLISRYLNRKRECIVPVRLITIED
jgi:phosphoribosylglycinamide formyltransferase 1